MRNSIITVIGTPKSGISILCQCLRMLGMTSLDDHAQTDASTIHGLLFQDLDHSPTMSGPLPHGWMRTPGAERARQRINPLIAACRNETGSLFLADPFLCRFMSLWTEAFQEAGLAHRFVLMVRHPWEAAPSLARVENIDLAKAHLLWLAHVRDALRSCKDQGHILVTFDQLLADPVSALARTGTELDLTWPNDPWSFSSSLLDFVQPGLKRHHASNLPDKNKQKFQAYERLYQEIRRGQWTGMVEGNAGKLRQLQNPNAILPAAKGIMPVQPPTDAEPDLIDSLLDVVGQYEKQAASRQTEQERIAVEAGPPIFAQVVFPSDLEGGEVVETIPLLTEEWQHIAVPVPESTLLKDKPIIFKPLNTNGTVHISAINLANRATGKTAWAANSVQDFDQIDIKGGAIRLPDRNKLVLAIFGQKPEIWLSASKDIPDCPLVLEVWIKASRDQDRFVRYLGKSQHKKVLKAPAINRHFMQKLKSITNTGGFHRQFKDRSDVFLKKSTEDSHSLVNGNTFWGAGIHLLPKNEVVSSKIYAFGFFELELCSFFIDYLFQGAVVIDIGAHIGFFSMLTAELVGENGKVYSFEPTPSTGEVLQKNVRPYPQVTVISKLVWSSETQLDFHDYGTEFSAYNTAVSDRLSPEEKKLAIDNLIKVDTVTLDAFCKEHNILPDLVKIDAESAEMQVLKGMTGLLKNVRPLVTIEVGDMESTLQDGVPRSRELLELVMYFDYLPLESVGGRYQAHELKTGKYVYDNIIMVPIEKLPIRRPLGTVAVQSGRFS